MDTNQAPEITFESAMKRLEEVVASLEKGELSLEASMKLYKEGSDCATYCRKKLESAKQELQVWQEEDELDAEEPEEDEDDDQ